MTTPTTTQTGYERALAAAPQLRPIARAVDALCALVRRDDTLCSGCVWEGIVKPLVTPWIGWERGEVPENASDGRRERWLRTSEAFDAFTRELLRRLHDADPANGHGIRRGHVQ